MNAPVRPDRVVPADGPAAPARLSVVRGLSVVVALHVRPARLTAANTGRTCCRGHNDGRGFRSASGGRFAGAPRADTWRLSSGVVGEEDGEEEEEVLGLIKTVFAHTSAARVYTSC